MDDDENVIIYDNSENKIRIRHLRGNVNFNVTGEFSISWFSYWLNDWELNTFHILNYYAPKFGREELVMGDDIKRNTYLDIGAWIGPTVLYAANFYPSVIAIEPDPVAFERLEKNVNANNYRNIKLVNKALGFTNGNIKFGGNGELGNSESTMLVSNDDYINKGWGSRWSSVERGQNIIDVSSITIQNLVNDNDIDPERIALIKMDIEGGELYLIPDLMPFLYEYDIPLYISLHYVFLTKNHINFILNILFENYKNCYVFDDGGERIKVNKNTILNGRLTCLVFENINKKLSDNSGRYKKIRMFVKRNLCLI